MKFWQRSKKEPETPSGNLEERVRALESAQRQLDLDLDDLVDRFQRLQARRAKRDAVDAAPPVADRTEHLNNLIRMRRAGMHNGA